MIELELTEGEFKTLKAIVLDWINEGFVTPPYTDDEVSIFEKLEIEDE